MELKAKHLQIPLRTRARQASFDRDLSDSIWVEARRGENVGLGEGCPRPYVTGEQTEKSLIWIESNRAVFESELTSLSNLRQYVLSSSAEIDRYPGAWCAVETALLDVLSREAGCGIESFLGLPEVPNAFTYTAVVSDESGQALTTLLQRYLAVGFTDFKFKLRGDPDADRSKFEAFAALTQGQYLDRFRIRLDANNVWGKQADIALSQLCQFRGKFEAVEEPLSSHMAPELSRLGTELDVAVILDESLCRKEDLVLYDPLPAKWIANVKVSKVGGILRAVDLIAHIRERGWPIIIGAQVGETSVLTRLGITAARAAGDALRAIEGGFGTILLEYDPAMPVLQFGPGGRLDMSGLDLEPIGLGLKINPQYL
jgi:L-alanine-DL-glutamate epimerase-like enolase superfamily enzyme